jgi:hypothetical protein
MSAYTATLLAVIFAALLGWFGPVVLDQQPTPSTQDAFKAQQAERRMDKAAQAICQGRAYTLTDTPGEIICTVVSSAAVF